MSMYCYIIALRVNTIKGDYMSNKNRIKAHFKALDRKLFMDNYQEYYKEDRPFPIGFGQTISQPSLVLKMTLLLDPRKDDNILEIGTGSGFQTALLAKCCKRVYTVEIIEALHLSAKKRLFDLGYNNVYYKLDDGKKGWLSNAPYDKIMVTAGAKEIPQALIDQLANNGKMVISIDSDIAQDLILVSKTDNKIKKDFISKVMFVDLV